jgi:hypothetical protein
MLVLIPLVEPLEWRPLLLVLLLVTIVATPGGLDLTFLFVLAALRRLLLLALPFIFIFASLLGGLLFLIVGVLLFMFGDLFIVDVAGIASLLIHDVWQLCCD